MAASTTASSPRERADKRFGPKTRGRTSSNEGTFHRHLSLLGNIHIGDWINGYFSSVPDLFPSPGLSYPLDSTTAFDQDGVDWFSDDGILARKPCAPNISDHWILRSAFACRPPVIEAQIKVVSVENRDGITVGDIIDNVRAWYKKPPTEDLRLQVIERMRELLVWGESDVFDLDGFETREEMLADLYNRQIVVDVLLQQGMRAKPDDDGGILFECFVNWTSEE
ncbi:hypothetical protein EHS25_004810 [Saitozyma podzolica]|uniref:Uncharacterized protein n=1 Tax=Saitozyma podzolica TaxID=1890683 RepID=A0A427Y2R0_9TREE|nr:hypothetical protein EHS25_004810 [Saitozyma podzolica]